jgi:hypothetical protein
MADQLKGHNPADDCANDAPSSSPSLVAKGFALDL